MKSKIKTCPVIFLSCILICASILACPIAEAEINKKRNILMVFSLHKNQRWVVEIEKGINLQYEEIRSKPNFFYEYMDAGRFKSRDQIRIFKNYLQEKYAGYNIDSVVFENPPAARLFISYSNLFENSKKYVLNPGTVEADIPPNKSTVIPVNTDYENAVNALLKVSQGKTIYLVAGATSDGKKRIKLVSELIIQREPRRKIVSLIDLSMEKLLEQVSILNSKNSVIFFLLYFKDAKGNRYSPYEAAQQISQKAKAPVYSAWSALMGSGIVGGYLLSGEMTGKVIASILINPMKARLMDSRQMKNQLHGFYYDWRQLNRWNIQENSLPEGSKIFYKKPKFYELYFKEIVVGSLTIVFVISLLWILRLRMEIKARLVVEENLLESEARFKSLSDASIEGIIISDKGEILDVNHSATEMFGYSFREMFGMEIVNLVVSENRDEVQNNIFSECEKPYEVPGLKKDGVKFPVEVHPKMYFFKNKRVRVTALRDLTEKKKAEKEIRTLKEIVPICSHCKKIRDDKGYWNSVEKYIIDHSEAELSHGICQDCAKKYYPEINIYEE